MAAHEKWLKSYFDKSYLIMMCDTYISGWNFLLNSFLRSLDTNLACYKNGGHFKMAIKGRWSLQRSV